MLRRSSEKAAALIIVLAFVVILTGLAVAYLSRATTDRQLAHTSFHDTDADLLAQSALDIVVGDFKQEIVNGSQKTTVNNITIYVPKDTGSGAAANMIPQRSSQIAAGVPNLIRRSVRADNFVGNPARPSRASAVNSQDNPSANNRYVTSTRWNSHYLVPKKNTGPGQDDSIPIDAFTSATPDWVIVTRAGPTPFPGWNPALTYPTSTNATYAIGRYAYAVYDEGGLLDSNLVGLPSPTPDAVTIASPSPSRTAYISRRGTVAFADLTALPLTAGGSTPNPMTISRVVGWRNYVTTSVSAGQTFPDLSPSPSPFATYFLDNSRDFLTVNPTPSPPGRTDQALATRAELIQLLAKIGDSNPDADITNLLQYLGTFSRELNAPTWQSASNPIWQRFQLDNISLLGSSPTPAPSPGNAPAIQAAFGLQWSTTDGRWQYVGTQGTTLLSAIPTPAPGGSPAPDFFQILNYAYPGHSIAQILSLGASIIDQYDADHVTTAIEYSGSPGVAWGMEDQDPPSPMGSPSPSPVPTPIPGYMVLQRPFQNVGELGYAYNPASGATLNFYRSDSSDAAILDFFTHNTTNNTAAYNLPIPLRAGPVNINTRNAPVLAAILSGASQSETSPTTGVSPGTARTAATLIANETGRQPAIGRQDLARLTAAVGITIGSKEEEEETVARALVDTTQTRTWGLLIDVVAQSGHYPPNASTLAGFMVEGEKRYWLHVAIDRFTGQIVDQQLEAVTE